MSRSRPHTLVVVALVGVGVGALLVARAFIAPPRQAAEKKNDEPAAAPEAPTAVAPVGLGRVKLAIALPANSALSSISYAVVSAAHIVVARGSAPVEKQTAIVSPPAIALAGGKGYTLSVVGNSTVGGVKRATYLGSGGFDVAPDRDTPVSFTPNAGVDHAAGESAGAAVAAGSGGAVDNATACQSCELSSSQGVCASENITATSNTDPKTGDQTGVGWGCATLGDSKAQSACLALLHCLNVKDCGHPGESPITGCYCGAAPAEACMGGQGITGACIAEYQAAAIASPGGPALGAASGQLSRFIATAAGDPTTPVGLADNIKHCAAETNCEVCQAL